MNRLPQKVRVPLVLLGEVMVIAFFVLVAWAGWQVLAVLGGTNLVSLPWVPRRVAQSVIPIGALLFVAARVLGLPDALKPPVLGEEEHLRFVEPLAQDPGGESEGPERRR